jgi:hypothetical protein
MTTNREERVERAADAILAGGVTLAFDTNCIIGKKTGALTFGAFAKIANAVDTLRSLERTPHKLDIVVPSPVHFEVLHDLRVELHGKDAAFNPKLVTSSLKSKGVRVVPFDPVTTSEKLYEWYPTDEEWRAAKGSYPRATIDWLIATQAAHSDWVLVTSDTGPEYRKVPLLIGRDRLRDILKKLCNELGAENPWVSRKS